MPSSAQICAITACCCPGDICFLTAGTVNGVDKSVWGGIRKRRDSTQSNEEDKKKEDEKEDREDSPKESPGLLQRLKNAIFG